jgi:phosphoribosylformylglycinamidine synthase I
MKFGVVIFPGSNCDHDMIHVLGSVLNQPVQVLWHKDTHLQGFTTDDCIILPGGFSYGDYLRCGAIASHSPIMQAVKEFAAAGGYVWGICNGFQILCEANLLPGVLLHNINRQFICKNIYIRAAHNQSAITSQVPVGKALKIPIAHAEGRYYADDATLAQMRQNGQILFTYCDEQGNESADANPNGASLHIAGICNEQRNVFGMMPHPERAAETILGNTDGYALFQSLIQTPKRAEAVHA